MPRLLAVGHVTWDTLQGQEWVGGSVSYAALCARRLGWEAAVLTAAGGDFEPARDLPGISVFSRPSRVTTRFHNHYADDGTRTSVLGSRADDVDLSLLPDAWRNPDVLLLGPVAGELAGVAAGSFEAEVVGAIAQGWVRRFDADGVANACEWPHPERELTGVHALVLSEHDVPAAGAWARAALAVVPIVALTRGWEGLSLYTRDGVQEVPTLPREEVDPTGAGDVFAAAFLMRYQETGDVQAAAAFGACAASCVVEGLGASSLGDRDEIERRLVRREHLIEEGEWDE